jgi:hypothetical protein
MSRAILSKPSGLWILGRELTAIGRGALLRCSGARIHQRVELDGVEAIIIRALELDVPCLFRR